MSSTPRGASSSRRDERCAAEGRTAVAVVGLGRWGLEHARAYASLPHVSLVAGCDIDPTRRALAEREHDNLATFATVEELVTERALHAASVVTREQDRLAVVATLLRAGVEVLVEKPLAANLVDAAEIVRLAAAQQRVLMPGLILRFDPRYVAVREMIAAGHLGRPRSIVARRLMPAEQHGKYGQSHLSLMATIHDLDVARWFFGREPRTVQAFLSPGRNNQASNPDHLIALLRFDEGELAVVETGWVLPNGHDSWLEAGVEVVGESGIAQIAIPDHAVSVSVAGRIERLDVVTISQLSGLGSGALRDELSYFVECVQARRWPDRADANDGIESLRLALGVVAALRSGDSVELSELECGRPDTWRVKKERR